MPSAGAWWAGGRKEDWTSGGSRGTLIYRSPACPRCPAQAAAVPSAVRVENENKSPAHHSGGPDSQAGPPLRQNEWVRGWGPQASVSSPPDLLWTSGLLGTPLQASPLDRACISLQGNLSPAQLSPSALLPVGFGVNPITLNNKCHHIARAYCIPDAGSRR